jgi:hypothetical protein
MTEAAALSSLNALRAIAALLVEATDVQVVSALKTHHTAHKLTAARPTPALNAHSLVTALLAKLLARLSTTSQSFQTTAQPENHTFAQVATVLLTRLHAQSFVTALMVNISAQTKSAVLSGNLTHSSQNLLKTTAWPTSITSAHQPTSCAQTSAARLTGLIARPRTNAQLTLHSSAAMDLARVNQPDQTDALQVSPAATAFHSSALTVPALVIHPSAKCFLLALLTLL